jgi:hypothetical protein
MGSGASKPVEGKYSFILNACVNLLLLCTSLNALINFDSYKYQD